MKNNTLLKIGFAAGLAGSFLVGALLHAVWKSPVPPTQRVELTLKFDLPKSAPVPRPLVLPSFDVVLPADGVKL